MFKNSVRVLIIERSVNAACGGVEGGEGGENCENHTRCMNVLYGQAKASYIYIYIYISHCAMVG